MPNGRRSKRKREKRKKRNKSIAKAGRHPAMVTPRLFCIYLALFLPRAEWLASPGSNITNNPNPSPIGNKFGLYCFGAAEHSASELLRGDSIGTPTGSSSCLIPIGTRNSVSSFVYNYGKGKKLVSTWLNKPYPVWKRPFSIRKMFIPMMLRKPAVLHWNLCRIPFCQ